MSALSHLAQYGVSIQQAHDFIFANLNQPAVIFNTAHQFGVTNEMLAEIVGGGYGASDVRAWFAGQGFNASLLDPSTGNNGGNNGGNNTGDTLIPAEIQAFAALVGLNANTGVLSNATLHDRIVAHTGLPAYLDTFAPSSAASADGVLSGDELGVPGLGNLPATLESVESLYFGTAIRMLKAVDQTEIINELLPFALEHKAALQSGDEATIQLYLKLLVGVFEDPATQPMFSDSQVADMIVHSAVTFVGVIQGGGDGSVFENLLQGILPA